MASFDLDRKADRHSIALWFLFHGLRETGAVFDEGTRLVYDAWLEQGPPYPQLGPIPISWLMHEAALRAGFLASDFADAAGQDRVLRWYFLEAIGKYDWTSLVTRGQARTLVELEKDQNSSLIVCWIWQQDDTLRAQFDGPSDPAFLDWLRVQGGRRWPILTHTAIALADSSRPPPDFDRPFGVNLVGYPSGRFGIGEDVRMAAQALCAANIPFVVCDVGQNSEVGADDKSIDHLVTTDMPFRYTVFCTTGIDTIRAINSLGRSAFDGQYLIGFWPWELPEFPVVWRQAYSFVDEVWASTSYTRDAFLRSSPVPVERMPLAVACQDSEGLNRSDFGLPADCFLFVFAYDALSSSARKNPDACLQAFDRAFPAGDEAVGLVIKGIRAGGSPAWMELEARAARDPRLFLIDSSLERGPLLDLYRACDCFISLHRAEGFGRNIAECMMLGLPVIVTAYSGNLDFSLSDTAALVSAALCPVAPGEYPFGAGQVWADPDIEAASALMRRMTTDQAWRERLAKAGQKYIKEQYSPLTVGRQWRQRLDMLDQHLAEEIGQ